VHPATSNAMMGFIGLRLITELDKHGEEIAALSALVSRMARRRRAQRRSRPLFRVNRPRPARAREDRDPYAT
jgi:hypothetical protein